MSNCRSLGLQYVGLKRGVRYMVEHERSLQRGVGQAVDISRQYAVKTLVQRQYFLSNLPWNFDKNACNKILSALFVNIQLAPKIDVT